MKKIVSLLLCLVLVMSSFAGCQQEHTHTFDTKWQYDASNHWKQATCEHADQVAEKAAHLDEDGNDLCDVCGYSMGHTHTYESAWTQGNKTHYYKPTCGCADEAKYRKDEADHEDKNNDSLCDICKYDYGHKHTYEEEWTATEGGHWHAPSCGHDVDGSDKRAHTDGNNDGACDDCGDTGGHTHSYAEEWTNDENEHWHAPTCGHTVEGSEKGAHNDGDEDGKCDVCGYAPEHFHTFEEEWTSDKTGHWHRATCDHADQKDAFGGHTGYEETGLCEVCGYKVMFLVEFDTPDYVKVVDSKNNELKGPFLVKEGEKLAVYLAVPDYAKLEMVENAAFEKNGVKHGDVYLYKVTIKPTEDTVVTAVANKLVACEVVVDGAEASFNAEKMGFLYQTMTFEAPAAGRYVVYTLGNGDIRFGPGNATEDSNELMNSSPYMHEFVFEVGSAGLVTLKCQFFAWDKGVTTFKYYVIRVDDEMNLPYLEGSGYTMPTNAEVKVTFTLPRPGLYHITSSWPVEWNGSLEDCVIYCTKENQKIELMVRYVSDQEVTFDFDWEILSLVPQKELPMGSTNVTVKPGYFLPVSFTAPQDGSYVITVDHPDLVMHYYGTLDNVNYQMISTGQTYSVWLPAAESAVLYIQVNKYTMEEITTSISGKLTVESLGYVPEGKDDYYEVIPNTLATYFNTTGSGDFQIVVPAGTQLSLDGGNTWQTGSVIIPVEDNSKLQYMVRNDDGSDKPVKVYLARMSYQFTLNVGENVQTLIPGKEYMVQLSGGTFGPNYTQDYILSWTDPNITVTFRRQNLSSPAHLDAYSPMMAIYVIYNGTETADISFTVQDKNAPAQPQDYSAMLPQLEGEYEVNFQKDRLYVLTFTPDAVDAVTGKLDVLDNDEDNEDLAGSYSYSFDKDSGLAVTKADGSAANFEIGLNSAGKLTFQGGRNMSEPQVLERP